MSCDGCARYCLQFQDPAISPYQCKSYVYDHLWFTCDLYAVGPVGPGGRAKRQAAQNATLAAYASRDYFQYIGAYPAPVASGASPKEGSAAAVFKDAEEEVVVEDPIRRELYKGKILPNECHAIRNLAGEPECPHGIKFDAKGRRRYCRDPIECRQEPEEEEKKEKEE